MSISITARALLAIALGVTVWSAANHAAATIVRIQTTLGNIDVRLYDAATPLHVANMLNYINSNRYDGTFIHRNAKNSNGSDFVIQGGGYKILTSLLDTPIGSGWQHIPTFASVTNEPGISNLRGTIALAKGSGVSSGTSEWFINMNDANTFLDQPAPVSNQFTVFGRVILNGMTVAQQIANLSRVCAASPCPPQQPVVNTAFTDVPVLDLQKVLAQQDVLNDDVVLVTDVFVRNLPAGDYDFNGTVNAADYAVWRSTFGSTTNAAADGNGNGRVDAADFVVWENTLGQTVPGSGAVAVVVPEAASATLLLLAAPLLLCRRRRSLKQA